MLEFDSSVLFDLVVRDQDGHIYFRENNGRLLAGGFEPVAKPAFEDGKIPGRYINMVISDETRLRKLNNT